MALGSLVVGAEGEGSGDCGVLAGAGFGEEKPGTVLLTAELEL